jgi:hypothetical protein
VTASVNDVDRFCEVVFVTASVNRGINRGGLKSYPPPRLFSKCHAKYFFVVVHIM